MSGTSQAPEYRWPSRYGFDYLKRLYHVSIALFGGVPILLGNTTDKSLIEEYVINMDGLLISGGEDMNPKYFRQKPHDSISLSLPERDFFEIEIIKRAVKREIPILGICRGMQVINIAFGGALYQDLSCMPQKTLEHSDPKETNSVFHDIRIEKGSLLRKTIGKEKINVNSFHHQAVSKMGESLKASAYSSDEVIECLEYPGYGFLIGVQWHPEMTLRRSHSRRLFKAFISASKSIK